MAISWSLSGSVMVGEAFGCGILTVSQGTGLRCVGLFLLGICMRMRQHLLPLLKLEGLCHLLHPRLHKDQKAQTRTPV